MLMPGELVPLADAVVETCGGKAAALGALLRAGLPVPDGVVVPFAAHRSATCQNVVSPEPHHTLTTRQGFETCQNRVSPEPHHTLTAPGRELRDVLGRALVALGDPVVAVRSSASGEDTCHASAAGQHSTVLGVQGVDAVADAVATCWASLRSPTATAYRAATAATAATAAPAAAEAAPAMAVIVQRLVDADVAGVMFTPGADGGATRIEASWGLGPSVVGGAVTPDAYRVGPDGAVTRRVAHKATRVDRRGGAVVTTAVDVADRDRPSLDDATVTRLAALGRRVDDVLGGPQDVEWALADGVLHLLQARPVTAALPGAATAPATTGRATLPDATPSSTHPDVLTGTPGSRGTVTGPVRVVRGPRDFDRVRAGDVLVCPTTDPAWTPLLRLAGAVVTEVGGVLAHAAIVARERGIPAVLGVPGSTARLPDGALVTVDGDAGTVTIGSP